jgi:FkbM family methyltransferase
MSIAPPEHQLEIKINGKAVFFKCLDQNSKDVALDIWSGGVYPLTELKKIIGPGPKAIVDVGANVGAFSVLMAGTWPESQIFAFEPGYPAFLLLTENAKLFKGISVFHCGLGKGEHLLPLHAGAYGPVGNSIGKSSLNRKAIAEVVIRDAGRVFGELGVGEGDIDIVKIDTEGCERPILESLQEFLPRIKVIFVEYHSEDDRRWIDAKLAASHHLFGGKAIGPHRGEFCFLRRDLAAEFEHMEITAPGVML